MTSKLFTIHCEPRLTEEIHTKVSQDLKEKLKTKDVLEKILNTRSKNLGRLSFLRLHILNREFTGKEIALIRTLVAYARHANRSLKQLKTCLRRG